MKSSYFLFFLFCTIFTGSTWADGGGRGKYIFPEYKGIEVPDSLSFEEAFFVDNVTTIDFMDGRQTEMVVYQRIYINSKSAAEEFSKRELFIGGYGRLSMLVGRTIKSDGTIKDLGDDQIIETYSKKKNKYGTETLRRVQLIYEDLQVGDVVDLAYEIHLDHYIFSDLMYLEGELPSLYSRVTLRNMSVLDLTAYSLNNAPKAVSKTIDGIRTISWEKHGVGSKRTDYFNALAPDAPSFVFVLWMRGENMDYKTFYSYDQYEYSLKFGAFSVATKYFTEQGVIDPEEDKFVSLKKIIFHLENDFSWNSSGGTDVVTRTPQYMRDKQVNRSLFIRYVTKFMKEQDLRFEHCFTKSLLDGRFEHGFVSLEQMSARFLIVYDESDQPHFLFPPAGEDEFYYLDEIPFYMEGNQSIALYGKKEFLDEQASVQLPVSDANTNIHSSRILINAKVKDSISSVVKRKDIFKGQYSFLTRSVESDFWLEEFGVVRDSNEIDPIRVDKFYPYEVEYLQDNRNWNFFERLDDSLFWFEVGELLPGGLYQSDEMNAEWGDYLVLPFLKRNIINVFIQSENSVSLGEDKVLLDFENSIGSIKVKIAQMGSNVLKIQYDVEVKKRLVENEEEVKMFEELIQKYVDVKNKKWVIKIA